MSDIDQILAGGAGSSSRADFSGLADIPDAYWKGKNQAYTQEGRDLFKGGIPTVKNPDGTTSVDWAQVSQKLLGHGDVPQAVSTETTGIARDQLRLGAQALQQSQGYETGQPQQQPILPPSANRQVTPATPPNQQPNSAQPQRAGGTSIMQILNAQGIPNDQLGAASASLARQLGVDDPTQPIDINDPRVRNVVAPFIQQIRRAGVGNIIPEGQPSPPPQMIGGPPMAPGVPQPQLVAQAPQIAPQGPQPALQPAQGQPAPITTPQTGTQAPAIPSRVEQGIQLYTSMMQNPGLPASTHALAKTRLEFLQKQQETTPEQKNYIQAVTQGYGGTMADFAAKTEADKTFAAENTKKYVAKYDSINTAGERALADLPQLDLARKLTEDPNFYSGVGEKYNLLIKRALVALGGDPNTAAPQEAFRKVVSKSILDQIKDMAGTGQIRVAEINIMREAAANPDTTPQANRLLIELAARMGKRSAAIMDIAQNYNGGRLDAGFDRKVSAYDRANPVISDKEIPDFRKIIDSGAKTTGQPKFGSPADVRAAISAGKLKSGDAFTDSAGVTRYVPSAKLLPF